MTDGFDGLMTITAVALVTGWVADMVAGDPERLPHPVVLYGRWIAFWERRTNCGTRRKAKGAMLAVGSIAMTVAATIGIQTAARWTDVKTTGATGWPIAEIAVAAILVFYCLAGCTLRREVKKVFEAVNRSIDEGRRQVGRIVGRDTQALSAQEVRTAALETLAENLSDGVIAPIFWLCISGLPGMMAYKMVNTLDSMIGYRNERYKDFGCWSAKIDDIANYIPARLTALLIVIAGWVSETCRRTPGRGKRSLTEITRFTVNNGPLHASPNSGWPEAALAGILDCRFGGPHNYFGSTIYKPYIGDNPRMLTTADMETSLRVCIGAECAAIGLVFLYLVVI